MFVTPSFYCPHNTLIWHPGVGTVLHTHDYPLKFGIACSQCSLGVQWTVGIPTVVHGENSLSCRDGATYGPTQSSATQ